MSTKMNRPGPDRGRSWIIAIACCFINMMFSGMVRLGGILFVASVERFNVSRQQASLPFALANCIRNFSGPLVGYFGHRFGVRFVVAFGSIIACLGIASCFLAERIHFVTVMWGLFFGVGFGMSSLPLPVSIIQYFDKHRTTASGIASTGGCLGSFILPPIVEILLDVYGLSGTFLILAGFVLNCVPVGLLLKKPDFVITRPNKRIDNSVVSEKQSTDSENNVRVNTIESASKSVDVRVDQRKVIDTNAKTNLSLKRAVVIEDGHIHTPNKVNFDDSNGSPTGSRKSLEKNTVCDVVTRIYGSKLNIKGSDPSPKHTNTSNEQCLIPDVVSQLSVPSVDTESKSINNKSNLNSKEIYCNLTYESDKVSMQKSELNISVSSLQNNISTESKGTGEHESKSALSSFKIFLDPGFILILLTFALFYFTFLVMFTVIVDFARDIGIQPSKEKYILMSLSVGDIVGRLGLGWVTDRGYMTKTGFVALAFMSQTACTVLVAFCSGFTMMIVIIAWYGLSEAVVIVVAPLIVAEYIEEDKQTVAIPSSLILSGPFCLIIAPLIGFFREDIGSYDGLFYLVGITSFLCGLMLLLLPRMARRKKT